MRLRSRKWVSSIIFVASLLLAGHAAPLHAQAESSSEYSLPLFMPASNRVQQGFIRIINHSDHAGTVRIHAIDDSGQRFGPVTLDMVGKATIHLNSGDLESGNADKGLSGGVGDGEGNWRLELSSTLDIEPLAYIRTADGFLTSMHDLVVESGLRQHHVAFFNPASNLSKVSRLRLINPTDTEASVQIVGLDDGGEPSEGTVRLTLPAGGARIITAQDLESGTSGLTGRLGDGTGKWQLTVSADHPIQLINLLRSATGHLANLSTSSIKRFVPTDQAAFDAVVVGRRVLTGVQGDYIDFVSSGRFNALEDGVAYAGRYTYEGTGPASGRLALSFDGGSCEVNLTYVSATTGVYSSACSDGSAEADRWTLVEVPTTGGFAPRDQAAFDARFAGKRVLSDDPTAYLDIVSRGRFREVEGNESYTGRYTYRNTGANSGRVVFVYDDGDRCTWNLTFRSATTGTGTYSCVDGTTGSTGWRLVDIPASNAPDLMVQSPSVSGSSLNTRQSFTLRATVRNSGTARSAATTLRYYRSSDATISTSDTAVGTDPVGALAASGTSVESISLTAPSSAGTYYYGACVDTVTGESNTANNCSSGVRVAVSSGGKAVTAEITECSGRRDSFGLVSARIRGTVQARRSVSSVRVEGRANGNFLGIDLVGSMSSGQSKNFSINGTFFDSSATRIRCDVEVTWFERRSQGGGEVRSRSAMDAPLHGLD